MKRIMSLVLAGVFVMTAAAAGAAPKGSGTMKGSVSSGAAEAKGLVKVGNTICPVSGEPVGEMGAPAQVVYKGKVYNLCCPGCAKKFLADPEKYAAIAEKQAAAASEPREE